MRIICSLPNFKLSWGGCFQIGCLPHLPRFWGREANWDCQKKKQAWLFLKLPCSLPFFSANNVYLNVRSKTTTKTSQTGQPPSLPSYLTVKIHPLFFFLPQEINDGRGWEKILRIKQKQTKDKWNLKATLWHGIFFTNYYLQKFKFTLSFHQKITSPLRLSDFNILKGLQVSLQLEIAYMSYTFV